MAHAHDTSMARPRMAHAPAQRPKRGHPKMAREACASVPRSSDLLQKRNRLPGRGAWRCCTALALVLAAPCLLWLRPARLPVCETGVAVVRHRCRRWGRAALARMMAAPHLLGL